MKVEISFEELATVRKTLEMLWRLPSQMPRREGSLSERSFRILDRYLITPPDQIESVLKKSIRKAKEAKRANK